MHPDPVIGGDRNIQKNVSDHYEKLLFYLDVNERTRMYVYREINIAKKQNKKNLRNNKRARSLRHRRETLSKPYFRKGLNTEDYRPIASAIRLIKENPV